MAILITSNNFEVSCKTSMYQPTYNYDFVRIDAYIPVNNFSFILGHFPGLNQCLVVRTQLAHILGPPTTRQRYAIQWRIAGGPSMARCCMLDGDKYKVNILLKATTQCLW